MAGLTTVLAMTALAPGCVPWALGPSRTSVTGGGAVQIAGDGPVEASEALVLRTDVDVTQTTSPPREREGDFGLGFLLLDYYDARRQGESRVGASLSGRYFLLRHPALSESVARLSLDVHADVLAHAAGFGGAGGAVGLELELAHPVGDGAFADADANDDGFYFLAGTYTGEIGAALRAEVGYHVLEDATHRWTFTLGLTVRLPVLAGIVGGIPSPD